MSTTAEVGGSVSPGGRTARRRRPAAGNGCRRGPGCGTDDDATWLVTAAQQNPRHAPEREPWGTIHVRKDGEALAACGAYAVGWPVFWDREFRPVSPDACDGCRRMFLTTAAPTSSTERILQR